jgi:uncharacterized membrane protein
MATRTLVAVGSLCRWRAALGGIGLALLSALAIVCGPTLIGSSIDADRFRLGLALLLCGAVPATMALVQNERAHPRVAARRSAAPPRPRT